MKQPDYVASYVPYHIYLGSYLPSYFESFVAERRSRTKPDRRTDVVQRKGDILFVTARRDEKDDASENRNGDLDSTGRA